MRSLSLKLQVYINWISTKISTPILIKTILAVFFILIIKRKLIWKNFSLNLYLRSNAFTTVVFIQFNFKVSNKKTQKNKPVLKSVSLFCKLVKGISKIYACLTCLVIEYHAKPYKGLNKGL